MDPFSMIAIGGAALSAYGQYRQGQAGKAMGGYEAKQLEQRAAYDKAAGQVSAIGQAANARRVEGTAKANAANAGGGGESIAAILGNITTQGQLRQKEAQFKGDVMASQDLDQAAAARMRGANAATAGNISAIGTGLSAFGKIGPSLFPKASTATSLLDDDNNDKRYG